MLYVGKPFRDKSLVQGSVRLNLNSDLSDSKAQALANFQWILSKTKNDKVGVGVEKD